MIAPQTFNNFPEFGSQATKCKPGDAKYVNGFIPGEVFPAEYVNWFFSGATLGVTGAQQGLSSIERELQTLLACAGKSPNVNCFSQVYDSMQYLIQNNLGNAAACPLGTASAGQSTCAARADHIHPVSCCLSNTNITMAIEYGNEFNFRTIGTTLLWNYRGGIDTIVLGDGSGCNNQYGSIIAKCFCGNATNATCAQNASSSCTAKGATNTYHLYLYESCCWSNWNYSGQSGDPLYIWGTKDGINMHVWTPASLSVGSAQNATNANKLYLTGQNNYACWHWEACSGQPDFIWGGNYGTDMYVYSPTCFCVARATNANKLYVTGQNDYACWHWEACSGQPDFIWGGNYGTDMYVYSPTCFCVARATNDSDGNAINTTYAKKANFSYSNGVLTITM